MSVSAASTAAVCERDFAYPVAAPSVDCMAPAALLADPILADQWDALAQLTSEPNPFAERWYLEAALRALPTDMVRIVVVRDGGLVGLIPLSRQNRYAGLPVTHLQNWLNHNAFLGTPLIRKGAEAMFWKALLEHLDREADSGLFLHITGLHSGGPIAEALDAVCRSGNRRHALVYSEERALLERGLAPDAYLEANVRGKKRKELRRQHKRLTEEGDLSFERWAGGDGLDKWIDDFLVLEMAGWKGQNGSALACAPETEALFRGVLHGAAKASRLELLTLRLDGRAMAMLANFLTPPGAFSFKTTFDESYSRFSPGVLLQIENLALLEHKSVEWCDSCAAQDHPMIDSLWSGRRSIGRYSVAIGGRAKRAAFAALLTAERAKAKYKAKAKI